MSILSTRPWLRWAAPTGVLVAVLAAGGAPRLLAAEPGLPTVSASDLLVKLQTSDVGSFSGTVVEKADLGLPSLPVNTERGSSDLASLADGTRTLRVWYDGPQRLRMALLGTLGESDVIRNGRDLWTWHSEENSATHTRLPAQTADVPRVQPGALPSDPREAADRVLDLLDPSTEVTTDRTARVAGRAAYELVLTPRDARSLVRQVRIAVDGEQFVPLRVQVYADGEPSPALAVGFTQVSFAKPDPAQFSFRPPPRATVTEKQPGGAPSGRHHAADGKRPVVIGDGWTAVLVARAPTADDLATGTDTPDGRDGWGGGHRGARDQLAGILGALPTVRGDWGSGRLLKTKLFSALLTDDGRVLIGAVRPERLYQVAADPEAQLKGTR